MLELQEVLGYAKWGNFLKVIEKAKQSLQSSNIEELDHFADVGKIVKAGVSSKEINDMILSRYACYLIVQNGDPRKKMIALGQQYFAIQTRKQELTEKEFEELSEDERRLILRKTLPDSIKNYLLQPKIPE
ncbi:DNA-damage-inducible protein D [Fusobacterium necrophorum subsp. necrophorum]|nr:DNA-damage-inducible protein D [Fusobacterium necrophorum subsp. necrophorum]